MEYYKHLNLLKKIFGTRNLRFWARSLGNFALFCGYFSCSQYYYRLYIYIYTNISALQPKTSNLEGKIGFNKK